jgi:hypothetical protein
MFSFVLLLEIVMLATLSNTIRGWILRLSLGFLLMLMQTLPMTVWFFQSNIDVYKQEWKMQSIKTHKNQMLDVYAIGHSEQQAVAEQTYLEQAIAGRNEAKPTPAMLILLETQKAQQQVVITLDKEVRSKEQVLLKYKARRLGLTADMAIHTLAATQLDQTIVTATKSLESTRNELRLARDTLLKQQVNYTQIEQQHNASLEEQVQWHTQKRQLVSRNLAENQSQLSKAQAAYEQATQEATKSKFFNDAAMLLQLILSDVWIRSVCVFLMLIALLIDIMPLVAKRQLHHMPYAQKIKLAAIQELNDVHLKLSQQKLSLSRQQWNVEKVQWDIEQQRQALRIQKNAYRKPWYMRWA